MKNHSIFYLTIIGLFQFFTSCENTASKGVKVSNANAQDTGFENFFEHWNLILGDGSNAGVPIDFQHEDYFFRTEDSTTTWYAFKTPNVGNTHGTSNNTRTELAQTKKWFPKDKARLSATLKVMNVSSSGDARVPASYSVVVGQIHSADGHENEPLKIFYKKFPGHTKGSVFWNYEINTQGDDNSKRWDVSYPVWGYDFSMAGETESTFPEEPESGIELGEEFSYEVKVEGGIMYLTFSSEGHETKTFTKNLVESEFIQKEQAPEQVVNLFFPAGQNGVERENAYAEEGIFFKLGAYNQTNGKSRKENKIWCTNGESNQGNVQAQYEDGNYAEVWFKKAEIKVSETAFSNAEYFNKNDGFNQKVIYPNTIIPFMEKFKILLGNGESIENLIDFQHPDFFYTAIDGTRHWVVYKTPNSGITSENSKNTRSELQEKREWTPEEGGKLTGVCKVMQVSETGDARVAAAFSTVVGQIHSGEGHENEPLKIFYKKFPGHTKGSVFWNYEINTAGEDNGKRWDFSTPVWGYDMSVVGKSANEYPIEPEEGIELGEEFSYEINVFEGIMYLTFTSEGHETRTFTKNLISSEYTEKENIPEQVKKLFVPMGQDGVERQNAYAGELIYFKQGVYNQVNGMDPNLNQVWYTGANTFGGDIKKQYEKGCYAEVWFRSASIGPGTPPLQ